MELSYLSNGIRVAMEPLPFVRSFAIGVWVGSGCFAETNQNNGISHFIEHMLFKGTEHRSALEIAGCIDALGGQLNAFTAKECTCFYVNILNEHYGIAVDLLCDMILSAKLDPADIEREKGVVCEEIAMVEDTPDEVAADLLARAHFGGHPLGKTILGPEETVRSLTREDIREYMAKTYVPDNIVISVAGSFDRDKILAMLEEKIGSRMKNNGVKVEKCGPLTEIKGDRLLITKDIEQVNLCLGFPGTAQTSEDYFVQTMIANVLGGGMSSRLFQKVREENGMTYAIYAYLSANVNSGMLNVYAGMNPAQAPRVLELILEETEKMKKDGITDKEFFEAKEQLKGSFVLGLESTASRMSRNGKVLLLNDAVLTEDEVLRKIGAVTREDFDRNIALMLDASRLSSAVVGKCGENDRLMKMLRGI